MKADFGVLLSRAAIVLLLIGLAPALLPIESSLNYPLRALDAFSPHLFVAGAVLAAISALLGRRRLGTALAAVGAAGAGAFYISYLSLTLPPTPRASPDLRVLFFNVDWINAPNAARIVDEAIATGADILAFAEAPPLWNFVDDLKAAYSYVSPCEPTRCELLIATNLAVTGSLQLAFDPWTVRFTSLGLELGDGQRLHLFVSHTPKPWDAPLIVPAVAQLSSQYRLADGPLLAVGDFNMVPWSAPMRRLLRESGARGLRYQIGTWPNWAGRWGLPIDQVLVDNGARVVRISHFGRDLGSNHIGLIADIALPD